MGRSVWTKKFIRLLVEHMKAGKTKSEICDILGLTPKALQVGLSRFKTPIDKLMNPIEKPKVTVEIEVEEQEELPLTQPNLDQDINLVTEYVTRKHGFEVNIYRTNGVGTHCVYGEVKTPDGWELHQWMINGKSYNDDILDAFDLIKKPAAPPLRIWVWCDGNGNHESFSSHERAKNWQILHGGKIIEVGV